MAKMNRRLRYFGPVESALDRPLTTFKKEEMVKHGCVERVSNPYRVTRALSSAQVAAPCLPPYCEEGYQP